jgi:TRAP transporter TAXI family solute receptor
MAPAPPKEVTIAAGHRDAAYYRYCTQYAESLAENGITLHVGETKGSVENYDLLLNDDSIDIAIVQGGTSPETATTQLESIASVYPEPLWIFCRGDKVLTDIRELKGLRVAVGPTGSGTRCMSDQILKANGLNEANRSFQVDARTGFEASAALQRGDLDAAFFVTTADAEYISELVRSPDITLLNLNRQQVPERNSHGVLTFVSRQFKNLHVHFVGHFF